MKDTAKDIRVSKVKEFLKLGEEGLTRKTILQVIKCDGDRSLAGDEPYQDDYARGCLTIHRYFLQIEATGFVSDMSTVTYYFRMQRFGSCFLQAACVTMSYLLFARGKSVPPPNGSRLIRRHFKDDQLIQYVLGNGGDSQVVLGILEKKFFDCDKSNRRPTVCASQSFDDESSLNLVKNLLKNEGPGLVSKCTVLKNFHCLFPTENADLAPYGSWEKVPSHLIPHGIARFTTWNEPAVFAPLDAPIDANLIAAETRLNDKWRKLLAQAQSDERTALTVSLSEDSRMNSLISMGSQQSPGELSGMSTVGMSRDDDDDLGEDWSDTWTEDDRDGDSENRCSHDRDNDIGASCMEQDDRGEGDSELHAMILLGYRVADGETYWLLQNSWEGPMQIIEVSTEYFVSLDAYLYFYKKKWHHPKLKVEDIPDIYCPSPIAESSQYEQSDNGDWSESIYPAPKQNAVGDNDDPFDEL